MTRKTFALTTTLALALLTPPAHASFPGANGPLVVSIEQCYEAAYLAKVPWRGGGLTPLTEECTSGERQGSGYSHPVASPDGQTLLAIRLKEHCCAEYVTLNADGTGVTSVPLPGEDRSIDRYYGPSFAPDGHSFVFSSAYWLWAMDVDGSDRRPIGQPYSYFSPSWSPDGELIAVRVGQYDESRQLEPGLWLVRARDGDPVRRIAGPRAGEPDWSPDGRKLVVATPFTQPGYGETGAGGGNLYVVSRDGTRRRTLVHREKIAESQPTWSPDGRWIAWVSLEFDGGDEPDNLYTKLWRVRAGGGTPRKIRNLPDPWVEETMHPQTTLTWLPR